MAPTDLRDHVAQRIREIRNNVRVTQANMAARLTIDERTYRQYESGAQNFGLLTLGRIADALRARVADFFMPLGERSRLAVEIRDQGITPKRVREARKALGLTQAALGALLDYDRVTIARWESGRYAVPPVARWALVGLLLVA